MNAKEAIKSTILGCDMIWQPYVQDLKDEELLVRPVPGANHLAWQLGHLIDSERTMMEGLTPGTSPALPAGFTTMHSRENAGVDDPKKFLKKDEYLKLA